MTTHATSTLPAGLTIPEDLTYEFVRHELHENIQVTVTRYQRTPGLTYGHEHVTTVIGTADGILYGYTNQTATVAEHTLPEANAARNIAFGFLNRVDADYAARLSERWIDRHDELIRTGRNEQAVVAGIKVKTAHTNGLYAWVIVSEHGQVVTFERDVAWNSAEARRHTHMWLHDQWIIAHDNGGPELDPPLARLTQ